MGAGLGLMDGLSAWAYPEARPMIASIIVGSTVKGVLTGLAAAFVAVRTQSLTWGAVAGIGVGFVLSSLAAIGQPDHYWAIVLPGMLVGLICGYVTYRYGTRAMRPSANRAGAIVLVLCASGVAMSAQPAAPASLLAPLEFLTGKWEGTSEGRSGNGTVHREYAPLLRGRILQGKNRSVYPPQPANKKGEDHEDFGVFSFDNSVKRIRFWQFHVEGFVVHYLHDVAASKADTIVFVSESIENIPPGYRSRETFRVLGPDQIEEVFELADPGMEFVVYSTTRLRRVR